MKTIGIFPASGALATSTYTHLLQTQGFPPENLILICRHPERLPQALTDSGVRARQAAYESLPADLEAAFAGIDVLFLVSYPSHVHEYRVEVQLPAINAAHRAGVGHVAYSSLAFALPHHEDTHAEVMRAHLDSEAQLRMLGSLDTGFTWTAVREGLYHESYPIYTAFFDPADPDSAEGDEICIPHDGSGPGVSWAKRDELGEATAAILVALARGGPEAAKYTDHVAVLTGPREWTLAETVRVLGEAAGRKNLRIREVSVNEYVAQPRVRRYFGGDEHKATTWATAWAAIRAGETAYVSPTLGELLGREPEAFDVTIRKMLASG